LRRVERLDGKLAEADVVLEVGVLLAALRLGRAQEQCDSHRAEGQPHPERGPPPVLVDEHARQPEAQRAADERSRVVQADAAGAFADGVVVRQQRDRRRVGC